MAVAWGAAAGAGGRIPEQATSAKEMRNPIATNTKFFFIIYSLSPSYFDFPTGMTDANFLCRMGAAFPIQTIWAPAGGEADPSLDPNLSTCSEIGLSRGLW